MEIVKKDNKLFITMDDEDIEEISTAKWNLPVNQIWSNLFYNNTSSLGNNSDYDFWGSGSLMHEHTGSLTSSPLITECAVTDDHGDIEDVEKGTLKDRYQADHFHDLKGLPFPKYDTLPLKKYQTQFVNEELHIINYP